MDDKEKIFADGLRFSELSEKTPTFIIAKMSVKVEDFTEFMRQHVNNAGYINVDIKVGKTGRTYAELNTFVPQRPAMMSPKEAGEDEIPF